MKLKTLLTIGILLSMSLITGMGFGLSHLSQQYQHNFELLELSERINTTIGQIGILTTAYVLHPEPSKIVLWQTRHKTLTALLEQRNSHVPDSDLQILLAENAKVSQLFQSALNAHRTSNLVNSQALDVTVAERIIIDQLQVSLQVMASHVEQLLADSEEEFGDSVDQIRQLLIILLLALPLLIASLWVIIALRVIPAIRFMNSTLPRLADDPEFRLDVTRNDEIGELAKTFNDLATHLQSTRVSRDDLVSEVAIRKQSEKALRDSETRLHELAHHDALTGLPNRLLLYERLEWAIKSADRHKSELSVIFMDLDHFKLVNDHYGHPVGDQLLRAVAQRLVSALRENDTIARIGGDEFVLLLEDTSEPGPITTTVQKLQTILREPVEIDGQQLHPSASIGICIYPHDGKDATTLLRNADAAMYHAKTQGRGRYEFYVPDIPQTGADVG